METYVNEYKITKEKIDKLKIKISTMTIVVEMNENVNIKNSDKIKIPQFFEKYEAELKYPKGKKTGDEFMNQMTIRYKDEKGRKNIKVFPNGKVHMTGIKEAKEVEEIMKNLIEMLNEGDKTIKIVKPCLINSNTHMNMGINLNILSTILQNETEENLKLPFTFHDPNKYPGIRIKYIESTCLIFASGAVMIAGAKSLDTVIKTYTYITQLMKRHKKEINCPELLKIKKKTS